MAILKADEVSVLRKLAERYEDTGDNSFWTNELSREWGMEHGELNRILRALEASHDIHQIDHSLDGHFHYEISKGIISTIREMDEQPTPPDLVDKARRWARSITVTGTMMSSY